MLNPRKQRAIRFGNLQGPKHAHRRCNAHLQDHGFRLVSSTISAGLFAPGAGGQRPPTKHLRSTGECIPLHPSTGPGRRDGRRARVSVYRLWRFVPSRAWPGPTTRRFPAKPCGWSGPATSVVRQTSGRGGFRHARWHDAAAAPASACSHERPSPGRCGRSGAAWRERPARAAIAGRSRFNGGILIPSNI